MKPVVRSSSLPIVAVFDFDGTLTDRDSFFPFLRFVAGPWRFLLGIAIVSPVLLGYALKLIPNWRAKEIVLIYFLKGKKAQQLQTMADSFAARIIPKILRSDAVERLKWHQEQGHQTILLSASLELYLVPWAKMMGFDQVLGTQVIVRESYHTGRFLSRNCYGTEKVRRLQQFLGDFEGYCIYAYGDSKGDLYLLRSVDYPYFRTFDRVADRL